MGGVVLAAGSLQSPGFEDLHADVVVAARQGPTPPGPFSARLLSQVRSACIRALAVGSGGLRQRTRDVRRSLAARVRQRLREESGQGETDGEGGRGGGRARREERGVWQRGRRTGFPGILRGGG